MEQNKVRLPDKMLVRPAEAGELLSLSRTTIYELISKGELPVIRINGNCMRIPMIGLKDWITRQSGESL